MNSQKSLAAKMANILGEVPTMVKNGYNSQQKYQFVSVEDIKAIIRPLLKRHNIALFSSMVDVEHAVRIVPKAQGGESAVMTVFAKMRFVLVDGDSGEQMEHFWVGEANDYGDKATNKAATAAVKYWLINTFLLSTTESEADDDYIPAPVPQEVATIDPRIEKWERIEVLGESLHKEDWKYIRNKRVKEIAPAARNWMDLGLEQMGKIWDKLQDEITTTATVESYG